MNARLAALRANNPAQSSWLRDPSASPRLRVRLFFRHSFPVRFNLIPTRIRRLFVDRLNVAVQPKFPPDCNI
jgi:hypothetical protein